MSGIIVDVIFLLFVLLFGVIGYSKGFLRTVLSLLGFVASIFIAYLLADSFAIVLNNLFGWGDKINAFISGQVGNISQSFVLETRTDLTGLIDVINNSDANIIFKTLFQQIIVLADFSGGAVSVADVIATLGTSLAMNLIAMVALFFVLRIVLWILNRILKTIPQKSVIGEVNKWLGLLLGMVQGLAISCVLVGVLYVLCMIPSVNSFLYPYIADSAITSFAYNKIGELILAIL